jgi:hypothetical protein
MGVKVDQEVIAFGPLWCIVNIGVEVHIICVFIEGHGVRRKVNKGGGLRKRKDVGKGKGELFNIRFLDDLIDFQCGVSLDLLLSIISLMCTRPRS